MKRVFYLAMTVAVLLVPVGCSGGAPENTEVRILKSEFSPAESSVKVGGTVTWTNDDNVAHTVTGQGFDSGTLYQQQSYSRKFEESGTYDYYCRYHLTERGKVNVR